MYRRSRRKNQWPASIHTFTEVGQPIRWMFLVLSPRRGKNPNLAAPEHQTVGKVFDVQNGVLSKPDA